jgi:membrane protease YdiL (CAAX protease family)
MDLYYGEMQMKKIVICFSKILVFYVLWAGLVSLMSLIDVPLDGSLARLFYEFIPCLITLLISFVFITLVEKKNLTIPVFNRGLMDIIIGIAAGACWIVLSIGILYITNSITFKEKNEVTLLPIWIIALFLNTIMQELLVRGYVFSLLVKSYNKVIACIITTVLFTVLHGFSNDIVLIINIITTSVLLSVVLLYFKNISIPVIMHFMWNFIGGIVINGISLAEDYPHLFTVVLSGNKIVSGGDSMIEGSIIVTILNIVSIMLILLFRKRITKNTA